MAGNGKGVTKSLLLWLEDEDDDKNGDNATFEPNDWTRFGTNTATTPQQVSLPDYVVCGVPVSVSCLFFACCCCCGCCCRVLYSLLPSSLS